MNKIDSLLKIKSELEKMAEVEDNEIILEYLENAIKNIRRAIIELKTSK